MKRTLYSATDIKFFNMEIYQAYSFYQPSINFVHRNGNSDHLFEHVMKMAKHHIVHDGGTHKAIMLPNASYGLRDVNKAFCSLFSALCYK